MTKDEKRQWREFREWKQVHDYEKKTKKPPALRGSRRVHDKQTGEWSYAPRSGFASGFLQLFSLFLVIIVLWNVASGAGYGTYKTAVGFLYGFTNSVGAVVQSTSSSVMAILTGGSKLTSTPQKPPDSSGYYYLKTLHVFDWEYLKVTPFESTTDDNTNIRKYRVVEVKSWSYYTNHPDKYYYLMATPRAVENRLWIWLWWRDSPITNGDDFTPAVFGGRYFNNTRTEWISADEYNNAS